MRTKAYLLPICAVFITFTLSAYSASDSVQHQTTRASRAQELLPARTPIVPKLVSPDVVHTPKLEEPRTPVIPPLVEARAPKIREPELLKPPVMPQLDELPPPVVEEFVVAPTRAPATGRDVPPRLEQPRTIAATSLQPQTPTERSLQPKTPTVQSLQPRTTAGRVLEPRITVGRE